MDSTMGVISENPNPSPSLLQDCFADEANDDDDDMFSLSDFPMYRDTTNVDDKDMLEEDQSFEFFNTEEWKNTNIDNPFPLENIIFCGNLIPSKKPILENTPNLEENRSRRKKREYSSSLETPQSTNTKPLQVEEKRIDNMKKGGGKNNVLGHKVSILRSSTKWHIYSLGMAKVPMEMELNDIRTRQSRRPLSPIRHSGPSSTLFGTRDDCSINEKVSVGCSSRSGKGLWGLIRDFGCHDHANTVVKASLVCIRRV